MIEHTVTRYEDDRAFLLAFADDTEDAPWMVASDRHFLGVGASHFSLKLHGGEAHPEWYVSGELFIFYTRPDGTVGKVAPDLFVALAPSHLRESFDARREGGFPPFVLEIVSPESRQRDLVEKPRAYDLCGATEYAIFDPYTTGPGQLTGYHRDERGVWGPWPAGPRGELWSTVLGLTLLADGLLLRFKDHNGNLLPIGEELQAALHLARRQWLLEREGREIEARRAAEEIRQVTEATRLEREGRQTEARRAAEEIRQVTEVTRLEREAREAEGRRAAEEIRQVTEATRLEREAREAEGRRAAEAIRQAAEATRLEREAREAEGRRAAEAIRQAAEATRLEREAREIEARRAAEAIRQAAEVTRLEREAREAEGRRAAEEIRQVTEATRLEREARQTEARRAAEALHRAVEATRLERAARETEAHRAEEAARRADADGARAAAAEARVAELEAMQARVAELEAELARLREDEPGQP